MCSHLSVVYGNFRFVSFWYYKNSLKIFNGQFYQIGDLGNSFLKRVAFETDSEILPVDFIFLSPYNLI
jgi:hypothetical protein